jgi:hypothetical protein
MPKAAQIVGVEAYRKRIIFRLIYTLLGEHEKLLLGTTGHIA